jgi:hypothetical protein
MNPKQTIPPIAKAVPALLAGFVIFLALKELFSAKKDTETKPETFPANVEAENRRNEAESVPPIHTIPAEIPPKPVIISVPSVPKPFISPVSASLVDKISVSVPDPQKIAAQIPLLPLKRKSIMRKDMETAFQHGARGMTRTEAVAALKKLGFGKSAAYEAFSENGCFSTWLRFAPDGIITWTDR